MTELLFQLAGGTVFLVLAMCILVPIAAGYLTRGDAAARLFQGLLVLVAAGVFLSAPPLPRGLLPMWALIVIGCLIESGWRSRRGFRPGGYAAGLLAAATCGLVLLEIPFLRSPSVPHFPVTAIHVVGDSLSAGIGRESRPWPAILEDESGIAVSNPASPGARLSDGIRQIRAIDDEDTLVLVLLGGNDILMRATRADFEQDLRALLDQLAATGSPAMLFELPVIAGFRPYGRIQRRLARDYDIPLIPASVLSRILSTGDATSDGIHLTDNGHRKLAEMVAEMVSAD